MIYVKALPNLPENRQTQNFLTSTLPTLSILTFIYTKALHMKKQHMIPIIVRSVWAGFPQSDSTKILNEVYTEFK
jgi:hypothetical protein